MSRRNKDKGKIEGPFVPMLIPTMLIGTYLELTTPLSLPLLLSFSCLLSVLMVVLSMLTLLPGRRMNPRSRLICC